MDGIAKAIELRSFFPLRTLPVVYSNQPQSLINAGSVAAAEPRSGMAMADESIAERAAAGWGREAAKAFARLADAAIPPPPIPRTVAIPTDGV